MILWIKKEITLKYNGAVIILVVTDKMIMDFRKCREQSKKEYHSLDEMLQDYENCYLCSKCIFSRFNTFFNISVCEVPGFVDAMNEIIK